VANNNGVVTAPNLNHRFAARSATSAIQTKNEFS
jgi:hypothetical protein